MQVIVYYYSELCESCLQSTCSYFSQMFSSIYRMNVTSFYASSRKKRVELALPVDVSEDELEISSDEDELQAHLQGEYERDENYEPENEDGDENEDQEEDQDEDQEEDEDQDEDMDQDEDSEGESAVIGITSIR